MPYLRLLAHVLDRHVAAHEWEEMATFHLFGLLGNGLLFFCYEWISAREVLN